MLRLTEVSEMTAARRAEIVRLRQLICRVEFAWGGMCLWCGSFRKHTPTCDAFKAPGEPRTGAVEPEPLTHEEKSRH